MKNKTYNLLIFILLIKNEKNILTFSLEEITLFCNLLLKIINRLQ